MNGLKNPNKTHEYSSVTSVGMKDQYILMRRPSSEHTYTANSYEISLMNVPDWEVPAENSSHTRDESPSVIEKDAHAVSSSERSNVLRKNDLEFETVLQYYLRKVEAPSSHDSEKQIPEGGIIDKYEMCHYIDPEYHPFSAQIDEQYERNVLEVESVLSWDCRVKGSRRNSLIKPINFRHLNPGLSENQQSQIDSVVKAKSSRGELWPEHIQATLTTSLSAWLDSSPRRMKSTPSRIHDRTRTYGSSLKSDSHSVERLPNLGSSSISRMPVLILQDGNYGSLHGFKSPKTEDDHFAPFKAANATAMISANSAEGQLTTSYTEEEDTKNISTIKKETLFNIGGLKLKTKRKKSRKKKKKKRRRPRKWEKRDIFRMDRRIGKIRGRKSYYNSFFSNNGRSNPWRSMLALLVWTSLILFFDDNYLAFARHWGFSPKLGLVSEIHQLLGIALGFLLYMQAAVSSNRWWNGRIEWQRIMEKNKRLTVLLNTHLNCLPLSEYGTRMIVAHTLCVWSFLQDKNEKTWSDELSNILNGKTVARIMACSRRLRPLSVTYAFQRLIELCVSKRVLEKEALRDINPLLVSLGESFDACNRCRITQLPWILAVHLNSVVFGFVALLPLTLIGRSSSHYSNKVFIRVEVNVVDISWIGVYLYVLVIGYAFYGLYKMAVDIEDPFSYKKESHSFGLWGLIEWWTALTITDIRAIFNFHIHKNEEGDMDGNGEYGEYWTMVRLEGAIKKAIVNGNVRNVNAVEEQLKENQRDSEYWRGFAESTIRHRDDSSEIYFSTAEEEEDAIPNVFALLPATTLSPSVLPPNDCGVLP